MPRITLIEYNGQSHEITAEVGESLMTNAVEQSVPGIDADCGGAGACGTCHCFVDADWQVATGEADALEDSMLGMRPDREHNSRLSCQIDVTPEMDGLVVRLPEFQM